MFVVWADARRASTLLHEHFEEPTSPAVCILSIRMRALLVLAAIWTAACGSTLTLPAPGQPQTQPAPKPLNVVLDGNSLSIAVNGIPSYASFLPMPVTNCAIGGQTTRDMLAKLEDVDAAFDPSARNLLIAWEGTNDLYFGATPEQAVDHLISYRDHMTSKGWTVILLTLLPRQSTPDPISFERQRLAVNAALRGRNLTLIDVGADPEMGQFASASAGLFYQADKVHLTDSGARRIAALVGGALSAIVAPASP
jgi:hypothetical protein